MAYTNSVLWSASQGEWKKTCKIIVNWSRYIFNTEKYAADVMRSWSKITVEDLQRNCTFTMTEPDINVIYTSQC